MVVCCLHCVSYFFREDEAAFWRLEKIQSRSIIAFFMAVLFAYWHREPPVPDMPADEDIMKTRWTIKHFFGLLALMVLFCVLITSVLFGIGWIIMRLVYDTVEPVGNAFVKMLIVTVIIALLATFIIVLSDRFGNSWRRSR